MPQADSKISSGQQQQQTAQTVPYPYPYPQQFEDDTIDLYELLNTLRNRKWLIIAVTVVAAIGSVVYSLITPRVYKAEALLLPPKAKDVQSMNLIGIQKSFSGDDKHFINLTSILADHVFTKFKKNLASRTLHKEFIQKNGLMDLLAPERTPETRDEDIYRRFSGMINLEDLNDFTSFSIELYDAEIAAQWVNDLIEYVDTETIDMLVEDLRNSIVNQIRDIEYTIVSKREMAKKRREDQIVRYKEAARIAKKLGINRRVDATNIIQNTQMNVDIATATTPLYYLGFEALSTEISVLRDRTSDDPFIGGLRDLQEELALLRTIKVEEEKTRAVNIDQAAYPPKYAIKPNRRLIVLLGTVVGLFSGVFLAFFIQFVQNQRKKRTE